MLLLDLISLSPEDRLGLWLEPDGRYQTEAMRLGDLNGAVADRLAVEFRGRRPESFPHLACISGKCRTGSTALTNLFGIAGVPAYYQPVKTVLRHRLLGGDGEPWSVPDATREPFIAAKEMTGPYCLAECLFNPLECLIDAGYPPERLHLLLLDRDPCESLTSWLLKWSDRLPEERLLQNFVLSSLHGQRLYDYARDNGIDAVTYVYDLARWPRAGIPALFRRLGIEDRFHAGVVEDWGQRGALESEQALVIYPDEPEIYRVVGLHSAETEYRFKPRSTRELTPSHRRLVEEHGLVGSYLRSIERCIDDLSLPDDVAGPLTELAG